MATLQIRPPHAKPPRPADVAPAPTPAVEALLEGQNRILELIAQNAPLSQTLDAVARLIEAQAPETRCSILLLRGNRLYNGAAPNLPHEFCEAVEGIEIGPSVGACGTAAFSKEPVITTDVATDPHWDAYQRTFTLSFGLRACWSTPIFSADQTVLGTFAIYTMTPSAPTSCHVELIEVATHMARIAIERHQSDERLKERAQQLAEADRRKDEFIALLAHELRNPLAPILMALEVLRLRSDDKKAITKYCGMIDRQVHHLKRLIDDLLDVSRITRGKIELKRELIPIEAFCTRAIELSSPLVESRKHRLSVTLPPPACKADVDPVRMAQVVSNLLNNAALYAPESSDVELNASLDDGVCKISVKDNGYGMDPETLARAFELFAQGDPSRHREQGGLGVGLALVRSIVELHGGRVEAHSAGLGEGSEFIVRIPATAALD